MVIHENARLTLRCREELVQCVARSMTLKRAAASFKVTPKTVTKWVRRYRLEGPSGLCDRSSRPRRSPRQTSAERIAQVILSGSFGSTEKWWGPRAQGCLRGATGRLINSTSSLRNSTGMLDGREAFSLK